MIEYLTRKKSGGSLPQAMSKSFERILLKVTWKLLANCSKDDSSSTTAGIIGPSLHIVLFIRKSLVICLYILMKVSRNRKD